MQRERDEDDAQDPTEESEPSECDATPEQCERERAGAEPGDEDVEASWRDEMAEQFPIEPMHHVLSPRDGMPIPAGDDTQLNFAPPFTRDHVVCVEDDREYVELFAEDLVERGWKPHWLFGWRKPDGTWIRNCVPRSRYDERGDARDRDVFDTGKPRERWGQRFVEAMGELIPVRPVRERCKYYQRQCWANSDQPDPREFGHKKLSRNCTMRRSIGGAFLSLSDESIYACDYRDPPDPESVDVHLDEPDTRHLDSNAHLKLVPLFGNK